jgi:hypothetical protein
VTNSDRGGKGEDEENEGWGGGRCFPAPTLLRAGEVRALIWKERENIHITYDCIQIMTISTVGE